MCLNLTPYTPCQRNQGIALVPTTMCVNGTPRRVVVAVPMNTSNGCGCNNGCGGNNSNGGCGCGGRNNSLFSTDFDDYYARQYAL